MFHCLQIIDTAERLRDTLIHELCHAACWIFDGISEGHGPSWKNWANKAMKKFPELPIIKRCHSYDIQTKFTYKCIKCGYRSVIFKYNGFIIVQILNNTVIYFFYLHIM